ncbi:hybrid sensor histidine kinase/response regulator [Dethiosulfatarculus sandiegensis]|uniref:hybrid sensor histidine kinase/response regulator n=1 Tax=Dethiosulfatarculus sandiegensis TaxID=1429043 RepID=UPI0006982C87|nr:PAS domain-containing sensor histidine kinase [Dethiosulfatarculus sandiegensis]
MPHMGDEEQGFSLSACETIGYHKENGTEPELVDALLENADQALFLINETGVIQKVNQAFCELVHCNSSEIISLEFNKILTDDLTHNDTNIIMKTMKLGRFQAKLKLTIPNHPPTPVEIRTQKTAFENQTAILCFVRLLDFSLAGNHYLKLARERYLSILESIEDGYYEVDTSGVFTYCNRSFKKMLGSAKKELLGKSYKEVMPVKAADQVRNEFSKILRGQKTLNSYEWEHKGLDGAIRLLSISVSLIKDPWGCPTGFRGICRDITERRYLLEVKRRFEFFTNASNDPVLLVNRDLQIEAANKSAISFLFSGPKEVTGLCLRDLWQDNFFKEQLEKPFKQCFQGTTLTFPLKYRKSQDQNQKSQFLQFSLFPFRQETGALSHAVLLIRDITKQERIQLALRESEARFRNLFINSVLGIYQSTVDGKFLNVNPAFVHMLGYSDIPSFMAEMRNNAPAIYVNSRQRDLIMEKSILSNKPQKHELLLRKKDGSEFVARDYAWTVRDSKGKVQYIEGFLEDISEQKKAEQKLAESRNLLLSTFSALKDLVVVISPSREIIMTNWSEPDMPKGTRTQIPGKCYELLFGRDKPCRLCHAEPIFKDGAPKSFESVDPRDESIKEVHLYPIKDQFGKIKLVVEHVRDITQIRKAEQKRSELKSQLRQARKMESLGTMAGEIAHNFNNILGVIVGFAQLAKDAGQKGEPSMADLEQILLAADRARKTVRQILTFSRKVELEFKPLNLNRTIRTTLGLLQSTMPDNIKLVAKTDSELKPVNGDQVSLEQILLNLAGNAKDAMPKGGTFEITTRNLRLDQNECRLLAGVEPGPFVLLEVSDSGRGMDQDTIKHMFEPFFTTKKRNKGTGLGLSSVYGIIKSHHGAIECASRPGMGTKFKIYIPALKRAKIDTERSLKISNLPRGNETVLVVDHEEEMLVITKRILEKQGYEVITKDSSNEALETYFKLPRIIDLIILNVGIPGLGGHAFLQELRSFDPQAKVLITSGTLPEKKLRSALDQGALGFLGKPFKQLSLLKAVRQILDNPDQPSAFSKASV